LPIITGGGGLCRDMLKLPAESSSTNFPFCTTETVNN